MSSLCTKPQRETESALQEKHALTIELEELGIERGRDGFVIWIMLKKQHQQRHRRNARHDTHICLEVWMRERLFDRYSFLWIKRLQKIKFSLPNPPKKKAHQSLCQKIDRQRVRIREQLRKRPPLPKGQRPNIIPRPPRRDRIKLVQRWRAEHVQYER